MDSKRIDYVDRVTFDDAVKEIALELAKMVVFKQRDYGPENILNAPFGPQSAIVVRLWDKMSRLKNLVENGKDPENESVDDTIRDIAGYCLVWLMVGSGKFEFPLEEK